MKKLLIVLLASAFIMPAYSAEKKPAPKKAEKVVKKHKKAEASMKVADDKPKAPAKKKK